MTPKYYILFVVLVPIVVYLGVHAAAIAGRLPEILVERTARAVVGTEMVLAIGFGLVAYTDDFSMVDVSAEMQILALGVMAWGVGVIMLVALIVSALKYRDQVGGYTEPDLREEP